jgi:adenylate cyclase
VLEKWRHLVPYEGVNWEVDVYEGLLEGVVLAEIEMRTPDEKLNIPPWIGQEVTGNSKYKKINMVAERVKAVA